MITKRFPFFVFGCSGSWMLLTGCTKCYLNNKCYLAKLPIDKTFEFRMKVNKVTGAKNSDENVINYPFKSNGWISGDLVNSVFR